MPPLIFQGVLLLAMATGARLQAQEPGQEPPNSPPPRPATEAISAVIADRNGDFVPDRLGERVTVRGVVTSNPTRRRGNSAMAALQDDDSGVLLFSPVARRLVNRVKAGDEITATGPVGQIDGAEVIRVQIIEFLREATLPDPIPLTTQDITDEKYSGRLVKIRGEVEVLDRLDPSGVAAILRDAHGRLHFSIPMRFYQEPGFVRDLMTVSEVELVGIASQADTQPPLNDNYRLVPRTTADFAFFPDPPYRAMLVTISVSLLLLASLMLWQSRRNAEKSATEMRQLTRELQASEHKLRESENRLRLLTQQVPAIVWSVDRSLRFTSSAGAGLKALELRQNEVVGMSLNEYFKTEDHRTPAIAAHRRAINGRSTTFQANWADRVYECHVEPLRDGEGDIVGAIGLALDITARHRAEKDLREQSDALRHSQKMEAIGRLAGGVAHDFNNLVTVIRGYCDLISLKLGPDHDLQDWFHEIKDSANRASSLTRQLLAFSRKQVLEPRVFDLNEILADMNKLLTRIIGEHIELVTDLAPKLGPVKIDKGQIEQVIMNLAVNAYDAMPKGGRLVVKTADYTVARDGSGTSPTAPPPGRYSMISFQDNGEGMSDEVRSRIFEPFFTTKEIGKGTGLGLSTVYGIISQSGGFVDVDSVVGAGTTFRIFLPVAETGHTDQHRKAETITQTNGTETILVAEDEPAVRSLIVRSLEDRGYRVLEAENGLEALRISQQTSDEIHCLITDVVMPKMSGFKLAGEILKKRPQIQVLYVSGYAYTGRHEDGRISPDTFLAKPFSPELLAMKVRRLLNATSKVAQRS